MKEQSLNKSDLTDDKNTTTTNLTHPDHPQSTQADVLETLELLAEKPDVQITRQPYRRVCIRKVVKEKTIQIPVTLKEEVLVVEYSEPIKTDDGHADLNSAAHNTQPRIRINGEEITLLDHQSVEVVIYREEAKITKTTVVTEQIDIGKLTDELEQQHHVTLQHEELEVTEQPVPR